MCQNVGILGYVFEIVNKCEGIFFLW